MTPIICFGQQPCGFFPKRFLVAKIFTARRLQKEIGGEIVFFFHDADHDPRETKTTLRHKKFGDAIHLNFDFLNKIQRKYSPLNYKQILPEWHKKTGRQLPEYVSPELVEILKSTPPTNAADFCLTIYHKMGLLEGIRIARSSDPALRTAACDITDYFVDIPFENETVRARYFPGDSPGSFSLKLHEGGDAYITVPPPYPPITKDKISPTRDSRLRWMQSVLHCTHYIAGMGEQAYLNKSDAPEITFVNRDPIDRLDEAWTEFP